MKFFFDNCISYKLAEALRPLFEEHTFVPLREKFPKNAADAAWIPPLGEEGGWIVITDDRLWKVREQRLALKKAGLVVFATPKRWGKQFKLTDQAAKLIQLWPKLVEEASRASPGAWFAIPSKGFNFKRLN